MNFHPFIWLGATGLGIGFGLALGLVGLSEGLYLITGPLVAMP